MGLNRVTIMTYSTLITATELAFHLTDPAWVVVDCRFDLMHPQKGYADYLAGHIYGARYANLDNDLAGVKFPGGGRHPLPDPEKFMQCLEAWGITPSTQVVAYDDAGGAIAARLWWLLHNWLRHRGVAVLDGGMRVWQEAGQLLSTEIPAVSTTHYRVQTDDSCWVDAAEVAGLAHGDGVLLDARAAPRFMGMVEPIDPIAGHVPWARNHPFSQNLDESGRFLDPELLREAYKKEFVEVSAGAKVIHMCGSGVTACHNILGMKRAGLADSQLYVGSWSGWIDPPGRPIAKSTTD